MTTEGYAKMTLRYTLKTKVKQLIRKNQDVLSTGEYNFLAKSLTLEHRMPQFYITAKVHKFPWKTRPIVSTSGSLLAYLSKWVDYNLNQIAKKSPTYILNSLQVKKEFEKLESLPKNAIIFTADAVSMYTNIDTRHGIITIARYLRQYHPELENIDAIIEGLGLVMNYNIFQFGDCYFKQKAGTAMGTPVACAYATLYYAYHERNTLLPRFGDNLRYLKRYIDDSIGIFLPNPENPDLWDEFTRTWPFGKLRWEFETSTKRVNFLDLTIILDKEQNFYTKTYEKPLNLHLYIPSHSAHPPGVQKGMIFGNLQRYWNQNSKREDFKEITKKFFSYLLKRGYKQEKIKPTFIQAIEKFENMEHWKTSTKPHSSNIKTDKESVFLHFEYHPRDISRSNIQTLFNEVFFKEEKGKESLKKITGETHPEYGGGGTLCIDKAVIAYSRAKNLRDWVSPSTLYQCPGKEVSKHLTRYRQRSSQE